MAENAKPLLVFVVTEDWYFYSHRRPMVLAAQDCGFDVAVVTNIARHRAAIEALGVRVIPFSFARRSLNPLRALRQSVQLAAIYRREKPALVHHIAMKPVVFGSVAARLAGVPRIVNAFVGLGYVFSDDSFRARLLRLLLWPVFFVLLRGGGTWLLFQNADDRDTLRRGGVCPPAMRVQVIRGSGVDLSAFPASPLPAPGGDFICVYAGRMIGIKGLATLKQAFALLAREAPQIRLWLCGQPDPENPGSWTAQQLEDWSSISDNVDYKGHSADMAALWAQCHVAVQASYGGEGVPKALLEAAACGRPLVASDVPGCREAVVQGENGFLVPPRDARALADALKALAADEALCSRMGRASRDLVVREFSAEAVRQQTAAFYRAVTGAGR